MPAATITAHTRAVERYYDELAEIHAHGAEHEQATRAAFEHLLAALARPQAEWTLILEQRLASGRIPDGTLRDAFNLPRGYWEAKDTADDLDTEIKKKIAAGYPTTNTIFEDTRRAVLYQGGRVACDIALANRADLAFLLNAFFGYREPHIESFEGAVNEFRARIPELADGLIGLIAAQERDNAAFRAALGSFLALCRTSLDPNIGLDAVREMLVQHLLTERLFRTVFDNPDFTRRNVIAAEIEKVIDALTSQAFNRAEFLRSLDRFYVAIEQAARDLTDWSEKQHFMNVVYERFFQGWSRKTADTHGIVYTPQEIVDFMCASVEEVLQREFGRSLSDRGVQILDPATGTGSFIVNLLRRISGASLPYKYAHDLFANEIMLLPYYIAALNIEHAYFERTGRYEPFEGLCFADTLELADRVAHKGLGEQSLWLSERNTERVEREREAQIMVVIGNPPYNVGQENENDNNKNRKYPVIDGRIKETYVKDSRASLHTKLYDAYVRFFRWAVDRLQGRDGIVCLVTNNSFVDQLAFDGMRKHLMQDFTAIYHLDLHGNVRKNPKLSGTMHNVFGIQVGVGITIAVRASSSENQGLFYHRVPDDWRRERKNTALQEWAALRHVPWQVLTPDDKHTWLTEGLAPEFDSLLPVGTKEAKAGVIGEDAIFGTYCLGVSTNRDSVVYDFHPDVLVPRVRQFIEDYNAEVSRWVRAGKPTDVDQFVHYDRVKWSEMLKGKLRRERYATFDLSAVRNALYRPFTKQLLYYSTLLDDAYALFSRIFPSRLAESENIAIAISDHGHRSPFGVMASNIIPDLHLLASTDGFQCFPLYTYDEDGANRRENITEWALARFQAAYGPAVTRRDIFAYVYAILHHPAYRERYAENLKRELPRIPLLPGRLTTEETEGTEGRAEGERFTTGTTEDREVREKFSGSGPSSSGNRAGTDNASHLALGTEDPSSVSSSVTSDTSVVNPFATCVRIGEALLALHLGYEQAEEYPLAMRETPGEQANWRVKKMRLSADKTTLVYNDWLTLEGIPAEVSRYRLGNRSALEWIVDQYQVSEDKRSGIITDPNRPDDPEYIVRLIKQVVTVSVETVRLVDELAARVDLLAAVGVKAAAPVEA
jgi:predicted helicase